MNKEEDQIQVNDHFVPSKANSSRSLAHILPIDLNLPLKSKGSREFPYMLHIPAYTFVQVYEDLMNSPL